MAKSPSSSAPGVHRPTGGAYTRLRPHVVVTRTAERLVLTGDRVWVYPEPPEQLVAAIDLIGRPAGAQVKALHPHLEPAAADELLSVLFQLGFTQTNDHPFSAPRAETPCGAYFDSALDSPRSGLASCSFVLVGCGGIGSEIARHLTASGAGRLVLIDHDVVASSNLNRQYLFTLADIGQPKVEAARVALQKTATIDIRSVTARIDAVDDLEALGLERATAVICCADTPRETIGTTVHDYARRHGSWFGICGVGVLNGFWGPILAPGAGRGLYKDVLDLQGEEARRLGIEMIRASFGPTNSLVAAALARDIVHAVLGDAPSSLEHRIDLDFRTFQTIRTPWNDLTDHAAPQPQDD